MKKIILLIGLLCTVNSFSQNDLFIGQTRFMQKSNASYFGFNSLNRIGVLYNTYQFNSTQNIDNKYFFGALSFDEKNFSLGLDFNSFRIQNSGLSSNIANFTYVYKVQINNNLFFLPAISAGLGSSAFNVSSLIFEDQLDRSTGFISTETADPLANRLLQVSYMDLGASFIIHNERLLMGLSLKHLNQPNVSFDQGAENRKLLNVTANMAYEFNLNPYDRGLLPRYTYLLAYGAYTSQGSSNLMYFSQEIQLAEFAFGVNQQLSFFNGLNLTQIGMSAGISFDNFDFGMLYNFPIKNVSRTFAASVFELYLTFDFSKFRRNRRGLYKRTQNDNYF